MHFVLIRVGGGIAQRFDPSSARRRWRSSRCRLLVAVITTRLAFWFCSSGIEPPLALVILTTSLLRRNLVQQRRQFGSGEIGTGNVELVIGLVEASMADQHQHHVNRPALALRGEGAQLRFDVGLGRVRPEQRVDLARSARVCSNLVEILSPAAEALFVFGFAAEAGDGQEITSRRAASTPKPSNSSNIA